MVPNSLMSRCSSVTPARLGPVDKYSVTFSKHCNIYTFSSWRRVDSFDSIDSTVSKGNEGISKSGSYSQYSMTPVRPFSRKVFTIIFQYSSEEPFYQKD